MGLSVWPVLRLATPFLRPDHRRQAERDAQLTDHAGTTTSSIHPKFQSNRSPRNIRTWRRVPVGPCAFYPPSPHELENSPHDQRQPAKMRVRSERYVSNIPVSQFSIQSGRSSVTETLSPRIHSMLPRYYTPGSRCDLIT